MRKEDRNEAIFWGVLIIACIVLIVYALTGCEEADGEPSQEASIPPVMAVDDSDDLEQQHRSHSVEAVEAGKVDAQGNLIDDPEAKERAIQRIRDYAQAKRDEATENAAEEEGEAVSEEVWYEDDYVYQNEYSGTVRSYDDRGTGFATSGVVSNGYGEFTWYSQRDLPGGGLTELNENGRTVNDQGFVVDGDGYIAVAVPDQEVGNYGKGDVIETPFGPGKVYDRNEGGSSWDIYTDY